jgi:hypothetical protein
MENEISKNVKGGENANTPLTGIYRKEKALLMQQAAEVLGLKNEKIEEGGRYPARDGYTMLDVKQGDIYIIVLGMKTSDYRNFWDTVNVLEEMAEQV